MDDRSAGRISGRMKGWPTGNSHVPSRDLSGGPVLQWGPGQRQVAVAQRRSLSVDREDGLAESPSRQVRTLLHPIRDQPDIDSVMRITTGA